MLFRSERGTEMREVEIGLDNNQFVHVLSGVEPGQEVMLTPPLADSVSDNVREVLDAVVIPTKEEAAQAAERRGEGESGAFNGNGNDGKPQPGGEAPAGGAARKRPSGGAGGGGAAGSGGGVQQP